VSKEVTQAAAREFLDVALRYRSAIDDRAGKSAEEFLLALYPILCELLFRASMLPEVWEEEDDADELPTTRPTGADPREVFLSSAAWQRLFESLKALLGRLDLYWEVFDPGELSTDDPMHGSLADDLADIYSDLGKGLEQVPDPPKSIPEQDIWNWRFTFYSHWGHHLLDTLRAIHAMIGHHDMDDPELWEPKQWPAASREAGALAAHPRCVR
jgi:hypothetical protein